jgi:uncharacterized repeat protein (TIGR01451 family)
MRIQNSSSRLGRLVGALGFFAVLAAAPAAHAQGSPNFDAVKWTAFGCSDQVDGGAGAVDIVGDATHPAAYTAHDGSFLYFRYRLNGNPSGPGGFAQVAWHALMQVPSGDPFQYQYDLWLLGKNDTIQIAKNTAPQDFQSTNSNLSEAVLYTQGYDVTSASNPSVSNTSPLARSLMVQDGSNFEFGGDPDYFLDFAFPIDALKKYGVIGSVSDLDQSLFLMATSTDVNNYNKNVFSCGGTFQPGTSLELGTTVSPAAVPANNPTKVTYTIAVKNTGTYVARGVTIDYTLPSYLANPTVTVSPADPTAPQPSGNEVLVSYLPVGSTVTVRISGDAGPGCGDTSFTNAVTAYAMNAAPVSNGASLTVNLAAGGCANVKCASDADCDDANPCTTNSCNSGVCKSSVNAGCTPCGPDAPCPDAGNSCTVETCSEGACVVTTPDPTCRPCTVDAQCDDGDASTTDRCMNGTCTSTRSCVSDANCVDADACTTDTCVAGACSHVTSPSCSNPGGGTGNPGPGSGNPGPDSGSNPGQGGGSGNPGQGGGSAGAPKEICGDCIDNDGDGLVDYDDPDCCATVTQLDLKRLMLKPTAKNPNGRRLVMRARDFGLTPTTFQPMSGATLQISDSSGNLFCQKMPASGWKHKGRSRVFTFRDKKGTLAGGLRLSRFTMKKNGTVVFTTTGKNVTLRPTDGRDVRVTLAVSGQCMQSTNQLRAKRRAVVFP